MCPFSAAGITKIIQSPGPKLAQIISIRCVSLMFSGLVLLFFFLCESFVVFYSRVCVVLLLDLTVHL